MSNHFFYYWLIEPKVVSEKSKAKYLKYVLRYLFRWKYNYAWVKFLNSSNEIKILKTAYGSDFYLKIQQPLVSGHLSFQQKYEYLKEHYQWFINNFNVHHYDQEELLLWSSQIELDDEVQNFELYFKYKGPFVTEGECALVLKVNDDVQYTLSFMHVLQSASPTFFIGGLQAGNQDVTSPELLKKMTKAMYGLRPKQFMIQAISAFADFYQVKNLIGVSNENHAFQSSRRKSKRARVKTNLDEFWLDFSSELTFEGNFYFRPLSHVINLDEIQSKKRSQYRKRQVILNDFVQQCQKNLISAKNN